MKRCEWAGGDPYSGRYHDEEWGVPSYDDNHLFEMITLEGAQAGLSWVTILKKREGYREAFEDFDPAKVARFNKSKIEKLLRFTGIVRNRLKVESTVSNARVIIKIQKEQGSFSEYIWSIVGGKPVKNAFSSHLDLPSDTPESKAMSKKLKKDGFRFVGPTTCYSFMQAVGMVNDHETSCYRYREIG
jgi:DNA-3-methyladenine glycosylase I